MEEGVRYECQRCGNCCRWPGEVPVSDAEIEKISRYLGMSDDDFIDEHTTLRVNRDGLTLKERKNGECIFLDGIDCRINPVKPNQCAGFPNQWNFKGWRDECEAVAVPLKAPSQKG